MSTGALLDHVADSIPAIRTRNVARVLLADSDLASRLTLSQLLATAGYAVEQAATAAEAMSMLDAQDFELVLAELETGGAGLLAFARQKASRPATALISSRMKEMETSHIGPFSDENIVCVSNEDVSYLLGNVAELISQRADRRIRRSLRNTD